MSTAVATSEAGDDAPSATTRRRSGRVSRKPEKCAPASSPTGSTKRKRGKDQDTEVDADEQASEEEMDENSEADGDEDESRPRRRNKKTKASARKPAAKKTKTNTNGESVSLAIRPAAPTATKSVKRPRKAPVRKSMLPEDTDGLYGKSISPVVQVSAD